jgi:hypothetical protein
MRRAWWSLGLIVLAATSCDNAGAGRVLAIGSSGLVKGLVYFDRNGNRVVDGADTALRQVRVRLIATGTFDTTVSVLTDTAGGFRVPSVPIGTYTVLVDTTTIGDSVRLVQLSAAEVAVAPNDSVSITATVSFPLLSVRAARLLPAGRKVFVQGILSSPRPAFGDTTAHLADTSRAIRLTRVRANPVAGIGDSLRALGVMATRDGQPVLDDVAFFPLGASGGVAPAVTTAAAARTAESGTLDAALVFVGGVIVVDTATVAGTGSPPVQDRLLTVDDTPADTAGRLEVLLDGHAGFVGAALAPLRPDSMVNVTGVLVPGTGGRWRLKPRLLADVVVQ